MRHSRFVIAYRQGSTAEKIMKVRQTRMSRRKQRSQGRHLFRPGQYKKLVTLAILRGGACAPALDFKTTSRAIVAIAAFAYCHAHDFAHKTFHDHTYAGVLTGKG